MKQYLGNAEALLNEQISGFHQYELQDPVRMIYASRNFCHMLGYTSEELTDEHTDLYALLVHPEDRNTFKKFLEDLAEQECTLSSDCRFQKKDGGYLYVRCTASSMKLENGQKIASATLTDISSLLFSNNNLYFLNENIPFGFVKYTCDTYPKVTYANKKMLQILRLPEEADETMDYLQMYGSNIYMMIDPNDHRKFTHFLHRVSSQGAPVAGEIATRRWDGSQGRVYGWVAKVVNENGQEEYQSVCMDVTDRYLAAKKQETARYLKVLSDIYDKIFQYDFSNQTVTCLYGQNSDVFRWLQNIPMKLEEATENWICTTVHAEDRDKIREFFRSFAKREFREAEGKPLQIQYRAASSSGDMRMYSGVVLRIDPSLSLFCCRTILEEQENLTLRSENLSLRSMNANMQELVMRFTDGIVAFEVENGCVKPLYASDNICRFFGYTTEEWIHMAQETHSIREFVSRSSVAYEDFMDLFENGEAEFEYLDVNTGELRRIRAVCSHLLSQNSSHQYVMLYNAKAAEKSPLPSLRIQIRTFGYFDVFIDEKPIVFRNEKSKELFALLVDRRGGYISSEEAISFLWENENATSVTLARYRKVALRLKNTLEEYGISDCVESVNGKRRIVPEKVSCDLYQYLSGGEEYAQLFKGSYLTNYSWSENTLGELLNAHIS